MRLPLGRQLESTPYRYGGEEMQLEGHITGGRVFPVEVNSNTDDIQVTAVEVRAWAGDGGVPAAEIILSLDIKPRRGPRYSFDANVRVMTRQGEMRAADGGIYELIDIESKFNIKSEASFSSYETLEGMEVRLRLDPA